MLDGSYIITMLYTCSRLQAHTSVARTHYIGYLLIDSYFFAKHCAVLQAFCSSIIRSFARFLIAPFNLNRHSPALNLADFPALGALLVITLALGTYSLTEHSLPSHQWVSHQAGAHTSFLSSHLTTFALLIPHPPTLLSTWSITCLEILPSPECPNLLNWA